MLHVSKTTTVVTLKLGSSAKDRQSDRDHEPICGRQKSSNDEGRQSKRCFGETLTAADLITYVFDIASVFRVQTDGACAWLLSRLTLCSGRQVAQRFQRCKPSVPKRWHAMMYPTGCELGLDRSTVNHTNNRRRDSTPPRPTFKLRLLQQPSECGKSSLNTSPESPPLDVPKPTLSFWHEVGCGPIEL